MGSIYDSQIFTSGEVSILLGRSPGGKTTTPCSDHSEGINTCLRFFNSMNTKKKELKRFVGMLLTETEDDRLREAARQDGRSISGYLRRLLTEKLELMAPGAGSATLPRDQGYAQPTIKEAGKNGSPK